MVLKRVLVSILIIVLIVTNILTLVNGKAHEFGMAALKTVLTPLVAEQAVADLLKNSVSGKLSAAQTSYKRLETKNLDLNRLAKQKAESVKAVSSKIYKRTVKNALKNIGDLPLEIVPFIGSAAIVALTVSDIYDDCNTLQNLNELNVAFELDQENDTTVCGFDVSSLDKWK